MKTFLLDQDGQGMTEYGLILAVIAVVIVVAIPGRVVEAILGIYESFLGVFEARKTL
ncbi:Flp pilus assembly pilin Flp [Salirhabdus euzebyi]|uniref:Flp pilus assembly pilin Flp n=1 Tax=Salirhabdus euzebyi TaxID=394506 RepID=A0A841Q9R6_9BACI|nr:Flp family type IVb pilin [Salirhabdus euzebyi]MBB6455115.1 Flp pilus assembly pilin Flp [Salirhabdus euzebyi]